MEREGKSDPQILVMESLLFIFQTIPENDASSNASHSSFFDEIAASSLLSMEDEY
jgi:hypothetical protein